MGHLLSLIHRAACAATVAAKACRAWEDGGDTDPISHTAWEADGATAEALRAVAYIDPTLTLDTYPETRLGRLAMAAYLLVLAGTDEGGQSSDLEFAIQLLEKAAVA